jgi:FG-GAP-like repeat
VFPTRHLPSAICSGAMKKAVLVTLIAAAIGVFAQIPSQSADEKKTTPGAGPGGVPQTSFFVHRVSSDHAEGIATMDVNGDGFPDIFSGAYWYENPGSKGGDWKRHQYRTADIVGEFVSDCGEWAIDVNHDGAPDLVTVGWQRDGVWWYENPKKLDAPWPKHFITHSMETEGGALADLNGDGVPDLALAHYGRSGMIWINFSGPEPRVHSVGGHDQDGHGVGMADVDGDGKIDLLTPYGWFRNIDADHDLMEWHADWNLGETGFPIIGYDVNKDGKMDLIYGRGHSYGLYWLEQRTSGSSRYWQRHTIDESFSQVHVLKLVDIDGDGEPELLAAKRYRGHNGKDPGSYDPLAVYYYKINRQTGEFTRYAISVGGTQGGGTQFIAQDLDGDGDIDIATAGKTGVHIDENLAVNRVSPEQREQELLLNKDWPFPGEGDQVEWQHGPKK